MTHVLDALGRIKEYQGPVALADLDDYARGVIIRGGAVRYEAYAAETLGAVLIGDGTDIVSDTTPTFVGLTTHNAGIAVGTTLDVAGHSAFGNAAAVNADYTVYVSETVTTALAAAKYCLRFLKTVTLSANSASAATAISGRLDLNNAGFNITGVESVVGVYGLVSVTGAGNIASLCSLRGWASNTGAGTVANAYIAKLRTITNTGGGAITTAYGLYLETQTAGGTNYSIYSAGGQSYHAGNIGIAMVPTANGLLCLGTPTENLEIIDAGSAGATEQDWVKVEVNGVQGFLHVFAAV